MKKIVLAIICLLVFATLTYAQCLPDCKCGCQSGKKCDCDVALAEPDVKSAYKIACDRAIREDKPLVVSVGPFQELKTPSGMLGVKVESLEGCKAGDIIVGVPEGGKLYWIATYKNFADVVVPKKVKSCNGVSCSETYFPVATPIVYQSSCPSCPNYKP